MDAVPAMRAVAATAARGEVLVKIRLKRMGAKKRPFYRLVVADSRSPRDGRFIELLGWYDPLTEPARVQVDADKVHEWMRKGARPSDAARDLLVREGILAKTPRVFKPAPVAEGAQGNTAEPAAAAAGASQSPGAADEVDAVDGENAGVVDAADGEAAADGSAADEPGTAAGGEAQVEAEPVGAETASAEAEEEVETDLAEAETES